MSNLMNNLGSMLNNGSLPDNLKTMFQNMNTNTNANTTSTQETDTSTSQSTDTNQTGTNSMDPEMLKNMMNMFNTFNSNANSNSTNSESTSSNSSIPNIDINMLMKMKSIMDKMNNTKDDPRSNLLLSLKPYLKESRKSKIEQYIQFFNMSKVMDVFNSNGGEKTK